MRHLTEIDVALLTTQQVKNLIKIADRPTLRALLHAELDRRDRERRALHLHQLRGWEHAKAEGRLR